MEDLDMFKVQKYSSEPQDIYLLIARDPKTLLLYLNNYHRLVLGKTRALYSIFYVGDDCREDYIKDISQVFLTMWFNYGILNVVASAPFSCYSESIYIYNPFQISEAEPFEYGVLKVYQLEKVVNRPYLIFNHLLHLNNYSLKTLLFNRNPTSLKVMPKSLTTREIYIKIHEISGYVGVDAAILTTMAAYLNFTIKNYDAEIDSDFGYVFKNGTVTGSLGKIVRKEADLSANGRFVADYNTSGIEFTIPYTSEKICIVVPKSPRVPQWMSTFKYFHWISWLFLFWVFLLYILILYFANVKEGIFRAWFVITSIFLSMPVRFPRRTHLELLLVSCMIINVIITGIFQGSLVKSFSKVTYYSDINTLEDLDDSGFPIYTSFSIFGTNESNLVKRLYSRTRMNYQNVVILDEMFHGKSIAGVERKNDAELFLKTKYIGPDGNPLLHIVKECPKSYFMAYILPVGSPLLPRINWFLRKLTESGLVDKWYQDTVDSIILDFLVENPYRKEIDRPFNLEDLQAAFGLLIFGLFIASIVFCIEIWFYLK
ncbi:unnamed protein product [Brassicogethes aeneus]|uniref:Uncharacterized protein n=1 Tax=Brassicogethes aeneus TaxID=1431903 RepID=A0A9P0FQG2_BRAAE|nr:unnamed protein product [Brassicogethes aeneus]